MGESMYEEENISITYFPYPGEEYVLKVKSTLGDEISIVFDQRILEDFSGRDLEGLSQGLENLDTIRYGMLSRTDVIRIHRGFMEAREKYEEGLEKFRKRQNL